MPFVAGVWSVRNSKDGKQEAEDADLVCVDVLTPTFLFPSSIHHKDIMAECVKRMALPQESAVKVVCFPIPKPWSLIRLRFLVLFWGCFFFFFLTVGLDCAALLFDRRGHEGAAKPSHGSVGQGFE